MAREKAVLVAGLAYGDEGKGSAVDYLVREISARSVIRYNGGAQAAHRVVLPDGRAHIFAQFGSGTFVPGVQTHLSRFMIVELFGLVREEEHLQFLGINDSFDRLTIDKLAPVTTPFHIATNRLLELARGSKRHGSCGLGIGEVIADLGDPESTVLHSGDLKDSALAKTKLRAIQKQKLAKVRKLAPQIFSDRHDQIIANRRMLEASALIDQLVAEYTEIIGRFRLVKSDYLAQLAAEGAMIFEGAQGMLLDPKYGIAPYVTKSDITFGNAMILLDEIAYSGEIQRVGVARGYLTRHGNGPFDTECPTLTSILQDTSNPTNDWQGKFRVGYFDAHQVADSLGNLGGVDRLAVTCLDRLVHPEIAWKILTRGKIYQEFGVIQGRQHLNHYLGDLLNLLGYQGPTIVSFGPTFQDKCVEVMSK